MKINKLECYWEDKCELRIKGTSENSKSGFPDINISVDRDKRGENKEWWVYFDLGNVVYRKDIDENNHFKTLEEALKRTKEVIESFYEFDNFPTVRFEGDTIKI